MVTVLYDESSSHESEGLVVRFASLVPEDVRAVLIEDAALGVELGLSPQDAAEIVVLGVLATWDHYGLSDPDIAIAQAASVLVVAESLDPAYRQTF